MAYAHVQGNIHSGQSGTTVTVTFGSAVTSGNAVTGAVGWVGSTDTNDRLASVTDDKGNTYFILGTQYNSDAGGTPYYWGTFALPNTPGGPITLTATITSTASPTFAVAMADEWSGVAAGSVVRSFASGTSTVQDATTGNFSVVSGDLALGYIVNIGSTNLTAGQTQAQNAASTWLSEWTTVASTGNQAMTATCGSAPGSGWSASGFAISPVRAATNFYVNSSTGNDSNPGTLAQPWKSVTPVNAEIYVTGDTVSFAGGQTFGGVTLTNALNGYFAGPATLSGANALTIGSYGSGNATIEPSATHGLYFEGLAGITVENLTVTGDNTANMNGVFIQQSRGNGSVASPALANFALSDLTISGFGRAGIIAACDNVVNSLEDVTITNCSVTGCTQNVTLTSNITAGILVGIGESIGTVAIGGGGTFTSTLAISNITASGCTVGNCGGTTSSNSLYQSSTGIFFGNCYQPLITRCYVHDNGANETQGNAGIEFNWCSAGTVSYCEVYNQISTHALADGDGIDFDVGNANCVMEYNYVHECMGAGLYFCNFGAFTHTGCVARFNICENNATKYLNDITVLGAVGSTNPVNVQIYNNTVYSTQTSSFALYVGNGGGNNPVTGVIANNLFIGQNASSKLNIVYNNSTATVNNNLYFGTSTDQVTLNWQGTGYSTLSAYKAAATPQETNTISVDPKLTNPGHGGTIGGYAPPAPTAYALLSGSPAIGAGADMHTTYSINPGPTDFYGTALVSPYNIGAYTVPSGYSLPPIGGTYELPVTGGGSYTRPPTNGGSYSLPPLSA